MSELISETLEHIKEEEKEVAWIGSFDGKYAITLDEFKELGEINYDSGYGSHEISSDLVVVFTDGSWMERWEYDGSEGWDIKECPKITDNPKKFTKLYSRYGHDIANLNEDKEE